MFSWLTTIDWEWTHRIADVLQIAAVAIVCFAFGMRIAWAWIVEAPRFKRALRHVDKVNDKQQTQIDELGQQVRALLDQKGVKKVTVKRRKK